MLRSLAINGAAAAVAIVVPVGLVTGSDGTEPDDSVPVSAAPETSTPDAETSSGPAPPEDIEFQIDMILGLVPQDEMDDYYHDQNDRQQLAIQECMNEAGFEYVPEDNFFSADPFADLSPIEYAEQWGFGNYTMMDPDNQPFAEIDQEYVWPNQEIVDGLSASEQNAWFELNNRCSQDAWMEDDPYRNPMVQQAMEDFETDIENDPRMGAAQEAWQACMEEAGHPFTDHEDMWNSVWDQDLVDEFYETEAWEADSPNHAEWQAKVDEEIGVAVADATCSPALYEVREEVSAELRPALVEVWQTIDWSLPPVTYPGEGEMLPDESIVLVDGSPTVR